MKEEKPSMIRATPPYSTKLNHLISFFYHVIPRTIFLKDDVNPSVRFC
jgi:hypothetical protein